MMQRLIDTLTYCADAGEPVGHATVEALDDLVDSLTEIAEAIEAGGDAETAADLRFLLNDSEE